MKYTNPRQYILSCSLAEFLNQIHCGASLEVPVCLATDEGSIVQKKTGSGISTPAKTRSFSDFSFFSSALMALREAAAAADLDDTTVSPVAV